jgi:hypothetical protein
MLLSFKLGMVLTDLFSYLLLQAAASGQFPSFHFLLANNFSVHLKADQLGLFQFGRMQECC